jgi:small nuclear ribonucleoprotein (snRNP)-like protein
VCSSDLYGNVLLRGNNILYIVLDAAKH